MKTRLILVALVLATFCGSSLADAPKPITRDGGGLAPFEPHDAEQVYIQQSLTVMRELGWNRGTEADSWWDWQMGQRYTFEPWAAGYPREDWALTPGQRFAKWWLGYCIINCDALQCDIRAGECMDEYERIAERFDTALARTTER